MTGRSSLLGRMTDPEILWRHVTGARETLLAVNIDNEDSVLSLPSADLDMFNSHIKEYYRHWNFGGL